MSRLDLLLAVIVGAVSGVAVPLTIAALSGVPLFGTTGAAPVEATPSQQVGVVTPSGPVASGLDSGSLPTAMPTNPATAEPTAEPTPEPTAQATPEPTPEPTPTAPAEPAFEAPSVMLGLPGQGGTPGATTPVASLGQYVTWTAVVGVANAGKPIDVEFATRLQGRWTGWSKLTSRVADAEGAVGFSWRQRAPAWISIRFALPDDRSTALQGRWR